MKGEAVIKKTDTSYLGIIVTCRKINLSKSIYSMLTLTKRLNITHYLKANQNVTFQCDHVTDCSFIVGTA